MGKSSAAAGGGVQPTGGRGSSAIVDVVHRRRSDRLAKLTFVTVLAVLTPVVSLVAATVTVPWLALAVGVAAGLAVAAVAAVVVFVWPALRMVWYWAGEITLLVLLLAAYVGLSRLLPVWAALLLLTVVAGLLAIPPQVRRLVTAWGWCAISRHRLRTCFALFIRANRYGSLPLILWARPTRAGERVWVWLRPGLSLEDLTSESGLDRLAVGCWAHSVKAVGASRRYAALLRVDITRRRPLAVTVRSPLLADLPEHPEQTGPVDGVPRPGGLDLDDVPTAAAAPSAAGAGRIPRPRRSGRSGSGPVGGADDELSDWI